MDMQEMMKMWDLKKVTEWYNLENMKELSEKNLENCKKANEILVEGMNTYAKRQAELTKEAVEANVAAVKELSTAKSVEEFVSKQQATVEAWVSRNTTAAQELAEIAKSSNEKAAEVVKEMMAK